MNDGVRNTLTAYAKSETIKALNKIFTELDLTNAEVNVVLSEIQLSLHMSQLRQERQES
jgi:hypothetical protein